MSSNTNLCASGHENEPSDQFCGVCGQVLHPKTNASRPTILYCTAGHPASPYDLHCGRCGAPVRPPTAPAPPQRPAPPTQPVVRPFPTGGRTSQQKSRNNVLVIGVIAALCLVLLIAGGIAVKVSESESKSAPPVPSRIRSENELSQMLLTEADLTYDWSEIADADSSSKSDLCPGADNALSTLNKKYPNVTTAKSRFAKSDSGPVTDEYIMSAGTNSLYSELKSSVRSCIGKSWTVDNYDGTYDVTMNDESLPKFGSESFGVLLKIDSSYGQANVWMVVVRVDDVIVRYFFTELTYQLFGGRTNNSARFTKEEVASIVRAGVDRVRKYS